MAVIEINASITSPPPHAQTHAGGGLKGAGSRKVGVTNKNTAKHCRIIEMKMLQTDEAPVLLQSVVNHSLFNQSCRLMLFKVPSGVIE